MCAKKETKKKQKKRRFRHVFRERGSQRIQNTKEETVSFVRLETFRPSFEIVNCHLCSLNWTISKSSAK